MRKLYILAFAAVFILIGFNKNYSYGDQASYTKLTAAAIVDPTNQGMTFRLSGHVINTFTTSQGLIILTVQNRAESLTIDVPIFPSIGKLETKPTTGDAVAVVGNLGQYKGRPQLRPLSAELIEVKSVGTISPELAHKLSDAIKTGSNSGPLLIGPVSAVSSKTFRSKAGKKHLKVVLKDKTAIAEGIIWESGWDEALRGRLDGGAEFYVYAKVGTFQNQPSLTIDTITFSEDLTKK